MNSYLPDGAPDNAVLDSDYGDAIRHDEPIEGISGASTRTLDNDSWYGGHDKDWALDDIRSGLAFGLPESGAPSDIIHTGDIPMDATFGDSGLLESGVFDPFIHNSLIYTPHNTFSNQASKKDEADTSSYPLELWSEWENDVQPFPGTLACRTSVSSASGLWRSGARVPPLQIPGCSSPTHKGASTSDSRGASGYRQGHTVLPKIEVSSYSEGASPVDVIQPQRSARMDGSYSHLQIGSLPSTFDGQRMLQDSDWDQLQPWNPSSGIYDHSPSSVDSSAPADALTCLKCPVDERRPFRRAGDYRRHLKKHDAPLHECILPGCGKTFYRHDKLKAHVGKAHNMDLNSMEGADVTASRSVTPIGEDGNSQEALYTCARCGLEFRRKLDFEKHYERKHVRRHECDKCKASFILKADLERHKNTVHQVGSGTRYHCTKGDCTQEFRRKDNLSRHIKRMHPEEVADTDASGLLLSTSLPIAPKPPSTGESIPRMDPINHDPIIDREKLGLIRSVTRAGDS
ncbi:hypothetical protein FB567DRAFT_185411 [Paraphoma chrysanthemicola]|uniref:C2H2-type domain-containing protein n=1 Tax=Paraphoma chrysanthemicola TaxID=798071 RepID=A0A8K0VUH7_9PLEO|nr:hypothetical protein FB567DRAFT_185411 [Paraphoma chrysanthemicola]